MDGFHSIYLFNIFVIDETLMNEPKEPDE